MDQISWSSRAYVKWGGGCRGVEIFSWGLRNFRVGVGNFFFGKVEKFSWRGVLNYGY